MSYALSPEQFVDYLIERGGLADFVELQLAGKPAKSWTIEDWQQITQLIWSLSERIWTPEVDYVVGLYQMQKERSEFWESSEQARLEKATAKTEMWRARAESAEQRVLELEDKLAPRRTTIASRTGAGRT